MEIIVIHANMAIMQNGKLFIIKLEVKHRFGVVIHAKDGMKHAKNVIVEVAPNAEVDFGKQIRLVWDAYKLGFD